MSSGAIIKFEPGTVAVERASFDEFCTAHDIVHSPQAVAGNVFYAGGVEVHYGDKGSLPERVFKLRFSTFFMGSDIPEVARLALLAWQKWGGALHADPEIAARFSA